MIIFKKGFRTKDIVDKSDKILGTQEIGNLLISELERVKMKKYNLAILGATGNVEEKFS